MNCLSLLRGVPPSDGHVAVDDPPVIRRHYVVDPVDHDHEVSLIFLVSNQFPDLLVFRGFVQIDLPLEVNPNQFIILSFILLLLILFLLLKLAPVAVH